MKRFILLFFGLFCIPLMTQAQCDFTPSVEGDTLLCPNTSGILYTQSWDSVQWYKRDYTGDEAEPIPGATDTFYEVPPSQILHWYSVEVTQDGCTERSEEVLVDGLSFLLPYVESSGEFGVGNNGETILCNEDSVVFEFSYTANVQWFRNGAMIPGATDSTLVVYEGGLYTAQGAPQRCPNYIQPLGLNLEVIKKDREAVKPTLEQRGSIALELTNAMQFDRVQWYYEDSLLLFNQDTIHPQSPGSYRVFSEDSARCPEWSDPYYWNTTAIEFPRLPDGSVFPNPVDETLRLQLPDNIEWTEWQLVDASGKMIRESILTDDIHVGDLSPGWYVLRIKGNEQWFYEKVLIQ